jgi:hypothetical protein
MRLTSDAVYEMTDTETNKQMIKLPKIDEVIAEAKAKGITAYQIAKETRGYQLKPFTPTLKATG